MIAIRSLHAERRSRLRGRRPVRAEPGATAPDPVRITRATVIPAEPFADPGAAAEWLRSCGRRDVSAAAVEEALALLNHLLAAHRVAAHDPYTRDVIAADAQRVRLGFGTGDELVEGAWRDAYVIPAERAKRPGRRRMLSPQEEMAGILSGRRAGPRPSEELILRARRDLDHARPVEAALLTRAAVDALSAEDLDHAHSAAAGRLAQAALAGELSAAQLAELDELVQNLERAVRRRRYG